MLMFHTIKYETVDANRTLPKSTPFLNKELNFKKLFKFFLISFVGRNLKLLDEQGNDVMYTNIT